MTHTVCGSIFTLWIALKSLIKPASLQIVMQCCSVLNHSLVLTSVSFAGINSLEIFELFWSWEIFNWMKRVFGFKVICRRLKKQKQNGGFW